MAALLTLIFLSLGSQALEPKCFPDVAEHPEVADWPVCAIYLHGLHPSNDSGPYTRFEEENRPIIKNFADEHLSRRACRIALPVAPNGKLVTVVKYDRDGRKYYQRIFRKTKYRNWEDRTVRQVESLAQAACPNARLLTGRALIGFSAGGWESYDLAFGDCRDLLEYKRIVAIGLPELRNRLSDGDVPTSCSSLRFSLRKPHNFPQEFSTELQQSILSDLP